ncbi:tetratricopeptide repeat protein [Flavobacterium sp. CYK-4]|uniref:O-antigen ligase family protein n=1 Tax=Flavobacterium lotistagni TaxID=2709660 RepID=UPI00140752B8|nr:O-antigen ligase [Flavobacterium lotistagni]NHM08251.1 tetratricopeptide repeat protein [Flavobacterium lotistagni]
MKAKIIERSYLFFLLLLPLVHFSNTVDPVLVPRQVYLSVFVLVLSIGLLVRNDTLGSIPLKNSLFLSFAGYFLFMALGSFYSGFNSESYYTLSKQLLLFAFLALSIYALDQGLLNVGTIVKACIGVSTIALLGAFYECYSAEDLWNKATTIDSFFANKNLLASFLFLCLPFLVMGLKQSKPWRILALVALIGTFPVLMILGTRTVFLALGVFGIILLGYFLSKRLSIRRTTLILAISTLLILILVAAIWGISSKSNESTIPLKGIERYIQRVSNNKTLTSRMQLWENSIQMWQENPWLGVGAGNWQVEFPKYGLDHFDEMSITNGWQTVQRAHNDFLTILCENGLIGLLTYLVIFGIIFYQLIFLIRKSDSSQQFKFVLIFGVIAGYFVIALFDFPLERIEHQIFLMLLFAITTTEYYTFKKENPTSQLECKILIYSTATIGLFALIVGVSRFKGEIETVKMYRAKDNELWEKTLLHAQNAENRFYSIDPTSMPIDWYKGTACFHKNDFGQSVRYFESAYAQAPYQIQVILSLGTAYENYNQRQKAIECYQKALKISSNFEEARLNLAAVYYNNKQYDLAFETIDKMQVINTNKKYKLYIMPILQKEINLILTRNNDPVLYKKVAKKITNSYHIFRLYYLSKQQKVSFKTMVLSMKDKDIVL